MRSRTLQLIRHLPQDVVRIFVDSHCFFAAAALAYFALLSLIPFFILTASLVGYLYADADMSEVYRGIADNTERLLPFLQGELETALIELVEARNITGIIGVGSLIGTSLMFFQTIEQAFSAIFPGSAKRSFLRSKGLAFALVPVAAALLGFIHYVFLVVDTAIGFLPVPVFERVVDSALLDQTISTALLAVEFLLVVYWFEYGQIRFRDIAAGAGVFGILWVVARVGFTFYVQRVAAFSIVYGSLGALVVLVLWVYYAAVVFLIGCCVTEALRRMQTA